MVSRETSLEEKRMTTTIYFVRHALPDYSSPEDRGMPLTEEGKLDSFSVAEKLSNIEFDYVISSPYQRTLDTIKPLVDKLNLKIETDERLGERKRGSFSDNTPDMVKKRWADFDFHEVRGESMNSLQLRNMEALKDILANHQDQTILVSTHGAALSSILNYYDSAFDYEDFNRIRCFTPYILRAEFDESMNLVAKEEIWWIDKN